MSPHADQGNGRRPSWTPEQIVQGLKELVTAVLGILVLAYTLILANRTFTFVGRQQELSQAKDVLLLMLGLAGVVVGYYFGRVPADARATQAQKQADTATAHAAHVSAKAEEIADQMDRTLEQAVISGAAARGVTETAVDAVSAEQLRRLRDDLRSLASTARRQPA